MATALPAAPAGDPPVIKELFLGAAQKYGISPSLMATAAAASVPAPAVPTASVPKQPQAVVPTAAVPKQPQAVAPTARSPIVSALIAAGGKGLSASALLNAARTPMPAAPAPAAPTAPHAVTAAGVHNHVNAQGKVVPYTLADQPTAPPDPALGTHVTNIAGRMGWGPGEVNAWNLVIQRESGGRLNAQNPTSTAYGIAQFINGPSEYAQYGGDVNTVPGQLTAMANYIKQRYGSPSAAWAHEGQFGWY